MKELALQKLICDIVNREHGGFARKLSHRFLVGVSDLLIKLPGLPTALIEVKCENCPVNKKTVTLDVTVPQRRFLRDAASAGMIAGIFSFLDDKRNRRVGIQIIPIDQWRDEDSLVLLPDHRWYRVQDRAMGVWNEVVKFITEEKAHGEN